MNIDEYAKPQNWSDTTLKKFKAKCEIQDKERRKFMQQYHKKHECCPKCGAAEHTSTLVNFLYDKKHPEKYKDANICKCEKCGDTHIVHNKISTTKT